MFFRCFPSFDRHLLHTRRLSCSLKKKEKEQQNKFVLVDGSAFLHRAFRVFEKSSNRRRRKTEDSFNQNVTSCQNRVQIESDSLVTRIFIHSIIKILREFKPKFFLLVFDTATSHSARRLVDSDYKKRRLRNPSLYSQFELILELCHLAHLPTFQAIKYEADDVIASVVKSISSNKLNIWDIHSEFDTNASSIVGPASYFSEFPDPEFGDVGFQNSKVQSSSPDSILIISPDKDLCQLVIDDPTLPIRIGRVSTKGITIWNEQEVYNRWQVMPSQVAVLLALQGDASDGISGVRGIGKVKAVEIIKSSSSLDDVISQLSASQNAEFTKCLKLTRLLSVRSVLDANSRLTEIKPDLNLYRFDYRSGTPQLVRRLRELGLYSAVKAWGSLRSKK